MALILRDAPLSIKPLLIDLIGGVASMLFLAAIATAFWYLSRYCRYKRYFEATGLTKCNEETVARWLATRDVTK